MTKQQITDIEKATAEPFKYQPLAKIGGPAGLTALASMMRGRIAAVLPKHVTPDRMLKALMVAASKTPALFECTEESICKSLMDASSLGLDCSGTLGSGHLIPFNRNVKVGNNWQKRKECQFIPGYRGLIDLARRGGQIATISAHPVYVQDKFALQYGTDEKIVHEPHLGADRRDEFVCFYAVAVLRDGTKQSEVMTLADVEKIRDAAMAKNRQTDASGPWKDHFAEMGRKTVVRRICKYLPLSPELEKAFDLEDEAFEGRATVISASTIDSVSRTQSIVDRLGATQEQTDEVVDTSTGEVTEATEATEAPDREPGEEG